MSRPDIIFSETPSIQAAELIAKYKYHITCPAKPNNLNLDATGQFGITLLHWALVSNAPKDFEMLLRQGASAEIPDRDGDTVVHIAASAKDAVFLEALVKHNAPLDVKNSETGETPLYEAIANDRLENIKYIVTAGADLSVQSHFGKTPLHQAAGMGVQDALFFMLQRVEDPSVLDIKESGGLTFSDYAFLTPDSVLTDAAMEMRRQIKERIQEIREKAKAD